MPNANIPEQDFFSSLKFFQLLPEKSRRILANRLQPMNCPPGTTLIRQGEQGDAVFLIEQGTCDIVIEKSDGRRFHVAQRGPGEVVGEMALLTDEPRQANVVAATQLKLWKLGRDDFVRLVRGHQDLQEFLTSLLSSRLENAAQTAERTIDKYRIEHKLGHGAWAIVYQGRHVTLGKKVAIKMLKHQMAMVPDFHDRFIREAKVIANMQHRNIITVYDVEERFNTLFIIMEYLEGTPLDTVLANKGPLPADQVADIFTQVCAGLDYAHQRGIVHQDIKPDNLFLMPGGQIKILDFGLACPSGSENLEMEGTIDYMAPEQIDSYPVDARTDIYCLGITAFELLTGKKPFPTDDPARLMELHRSQDIPDPATVMDGIPPELSACIMRCGRRDHRQRFQSAREAGQALETIALSRRRTTEPKRENLCSLHLAYSDEQKTRLTALLEEFGERLNAEGIRFRMTDFDHFLDQ